MYWEIDFDDHTEGLYTLHKRNGDVLTVIQKTDVLPRNLMYVTDPDLEAYSTLVPSKLACDYTPITLDAVRKGWMSIDAAIKIRHVILVGGRWEVTARIRKTHPSCFECSVPGGDRLYVSELGLGEPVD